MLLERVMDARDVQLEKAYLFIAVTMLRIVTDVRYMHIPKAATPIPLSQFGKVTD